MDGDGVQPKTHLIPRDHDALIFDEANIVRSITDEFAREIELKFAYEGERVAIGHCDLTKNPDGSIHASIKYYPQNPR